MKSNKPLLSIQAAVTLILAGVVVSAGNMKAAPPSPDPEIIQKISEAKTTAAQLEGALAQNAPQPTTSPGHSSMPGMASPAASPMPGMSGGGMSNDNMMMGKMEKMMNKMEKMMPMMEKMMGEMGGSDAMSPGAPMRDAGMSMGRDKMKMGMGMMGMKSMGQGPAAARHDSALPGFPGASHLYHIGATGFFLDHPEHISLTTEQQAALNKIKEEALRAKSAADGALEEAEQQLGALTGSDQPDTAKIEAKVREISKLSADQRLAFIRAVGEAAKLLTGEQRKILTGFATPAPDNSIPAPSATPTPMDHM